MEDYKKTKPAFSEACERLYNRISELARPPKKKISELACQSDNQNGKLQKNEIKLKTQKL